MKPLISILFLLTISIPLASTLKQRDSSEAIGNIQYFTTSWKSYTTSLLNISHTYHIPKHPHHNQPAFNTSTLPLQDQYAVIAVVSSYNMNFKYESYVIDRVAAGPALSKEDSRAVVQALKELVKALEPLFDAFEIFVDIIGKQNLVSMLGYQNTVASLITAVASVVTDKEKMKVQKLGKKHIDVVVEISASLGA